MQSAVDVSSNLARVFEEHVSDSIKQIDRNLQFLRHARENDPAGFDLPAWTTSSYFLHDVMVQIALIGADGRLVATNLARNPAPIDLSDREHFRFHRDHAGDDLFISEPVLGRTSGRWTIQITRRLSNPDGSFGGVLVASLDPYHLSEFFDQVDLGRDGAVTLIGLDGLVRARGGLKPDLLGQSIAGTPFYDMMTSERQGVFLGVGTLVGNRRLIAFQRTRTFPLVVTVAMSEDAVLVDHLAKRRFFIAAASGLTIAGLIAILLGVGRQMRLDQARAAQSSSERQARRKSEELEATLGCMNQGIVMFDADGMLRIANRRASELLGIDCAPLVGRAAATDILAPLSIDRGSAAPEYEIAGRIIEMDGVAMPDGGLLLALTDVTSHKQTTASLAEARDRAEAATRARTTFLATMSHELRTPLNGVVGMTRLLEDCTDPDDRRLYVRTMRTSAEHLLQIINDILDFSKIEADRLEFETAPFAVAEVVGDVCDIVRSQAAGKGLSLEIRIADDLPETLLGDVGRVRQILLNLVGNAVKFTDAGGVTVIADRVPSDDAHRPVGLRLRVVDTGIGIAPEQIGNLFVEFAQLDGSIARRFGGTGLGLAISRQLAERMGGTITVESRLGEGTTFTAQIPFAAARTVEDRSTPPTAPRATPETERGGRLDLLLVEDNQTNRLVATRLLEKMGHGVTTAVDGLEALERLRAGTFDLVLMDVMMPRMDGLEATRRIRAGEAGAADVAIVALTASAFDEDREAAFAAGADAFAVKPVSVEGLSAAMTDALRIRRRPERRADAICAA